MNQRPDLFGKLQEFDIILASGSPRRRELLAETGIPFRVEVRAVSEEYPDHLQPDEVVRYLCQSKAAMFTEELQHEKTIVITADTIVVSDSAILNKPANRDEAYDMLRMLSGKAHEVLTGICIRHKKDIRTFHDTTRVYFRAMTDAEIFYYIDRFKPFDKAGAYGIQEWIGRVGIYRIEGSYDNVVGFPVHAVYAALMDICGAL